MKFKPLPIEEEFAALREERDEEKRAAAEYELLRTYWRSLRDCKGFQLLVKALRDIEMDALNAISANASDGVIRYAAAKIHAVQFIRKCLQPPTPPEAEDVWNEEVEEDW